MISDTGSLVIDGVHDTSRDSSHNKDSSFFSLINDESRKDHSDRTLVASDLHSDSILTLQSARDITVSGSTVSATGETGVQAKGDINIVAAENTARDTTRTDNRGFTASTRETTPGSHEYRVDAGLKDQQHTNVTETTQQQGASIRGSAVVVNAGGDVSIKGSDLAATGGDVNLKGKSIELLAAHDSTDSKTRDITTGVATFRGQERLRLSGATVGGDLLKVEKKERQSLQGNIDQAIN